MPKNTQIAVALAIVAVIIFIVFGLFGIGSTASQPDTNFTGPQALLNEIASTGGVSTLHSYKIASGAGQPAEPGDTLTVHYTGELTDGTVFDSSRTRGTPFTFTLGAGQVIQGWDQGLVGATKGERILLAIPPAMGYGAQANGPIPANSTLIFDVEIVDIVHKAK